MVKTRTFVSFDYDHNSDLKVLLAGQAQLQDSPFNITDMSLKEPINENWKKVARTRIKGVDVVCVICGEKTDTAAGVTAEMTIAREEGVPYFLLEGRSSKTCVKPKGVKSTDKMYDWTWPNLKLLIGGSR